MNEVDFHPGATKAIKQFPDPIKKELGKAIFDLQLGIKLSMPLSRSIKSVGNGVEELRLKDQSGIYRTFYYTKVAKKVIIFHAFVKKTQKTPQKEILTGKRRLREMLDG